MRATSQVAEPSPSYCTASESGVHSRRCVDRCFATESRIPTAKHCGMFWHEPRGACVRRSGGLARRFRHQTGCGCNQAQTIGGEAVAGAPSFRDRAGPCVSHAQGRQRNAGGADRADPIFHPSNGDSHRRSGLRKARRTSTTRTANPQPFWSGSNSVASFPLFSNRFTSGCRRLRAKDVQRNLRRLDLPERFL